MTLEDHLGDVLRKARRHAGVAEVEAARAAGLATAAYAELESEGTVFGSPDLAALARLLHLAPAKLEALARGWLPAPADLGRWRELRQITTTGEGFSVNCYLAWDEATREAALFDTGFDPAPILELITANGLLLRHLCITHGHEDHVAGLAELTRRFPGARVHSNAHDAPAHQRNRPDECLPLGGLRITHRNTPGHAPDGVTYLVGNWPDDAPHVAIVGDAVFAGSMGKVPGPAAQAREVIQREILALPPATLLCPGHGPLTTVAEERAHNPFF